MAGVGKRSHAEINEVLKKLIPELDSEYARYPMSYPRWLSLGEKGPKGEPTWIKSDNVGIKKDYIYGRGPGEFPWRLERVSEPINLFTFETDTTIRYDM